VIGPPGHAFLAIADISGYTGYLAGVELDHATDVLADLIGTVVDALVPFRLSKLEGDAAFACLDADSVDPSVLQDCIEGTYLAFRSRLRDITQASRCECNACILIPRLDLKVVVHHGLVARQRMVGLEELVGADVILVHRLLKNGVVAATGIEAYALYTEAAVAAAGIDPVAAGLREQVESTDVAGDVRAWVRDLGAVWRAFLDQPRETIPDELAPRTWEVDLPVPAPVAWEYITSPARRPLWNQGITEVIEFSPDDRRGVGTTNHCMHGKEAVIERILAWQPPHYWLTRSLIPEAMGGFELLLSDELTELPDGGTHATIRVARVPEMSPESWAAVEGPLRALIDHQVEILGALLAGVAAELASATAEDPVVPESKARYLTSPVVRTADGLRSVSP
jgi:hypothetical protein